MGKRIVDLEERTETGTFELVGGGKVHLRLLTGTDLREMRAACVKKVVEYPLLTDPATGKQHHQRFEVEEFDGEKFQRMGWDRNITGYDDLLDKNEQPIPVSTENKVLLMELVPEFAAAVASGLKILKEAEKARTEQAEKN